MNRQQKQAVVDFLKENFSQSQASFIVDYKGLSVAQLQALRGGLREKGGLLKITKARLMKLAVEGASEQMIPFFKEQIGLVFAPTASEQVAKVLYDFGKSHAALKIVAGYLDASLLDSESVIRIAKLPSKEVLLGKLCGTIKAPLTGLVGALNQILLKPLWVLKQVESTKK